MIVKILGLLDLIAGFSFWLFGFFKILPSEFILLIAFYLLVKGVVFLISLDFFSIIDVICSLIIFTSLNFAIPKIIISLVVIYLVFKGVFSLV